MPEESSGPPAHSTSEGGPDELSPASKGTERDDAGQPGDGIPRILTSEEDDRRRELQHAATGYARLGWRVIPVRWITPDGTCSCPNGPACESAGKHPVHDAWPSVASSDPDVVASWWRPDPIIPAREWYPYANIGVVTGRGSGIFVLDVDTYAGGGPTLGAYERRNGDLPLTRVHSTGRGGTHYFFAHPGFDVRNSAKRVLGAGLDIRGENGFVVVPPSVSSGGPYELNPAHDIPPAPAPEWLLSLLRSYDKGQTGSAISGDAPVQSTGAARRYAEAALAAEAARMRDAGPGTRNDTLNNCAFSLGTLGGVGLLSEGDAWTALREAAKAAGLGDGEIRQTFLSGWRSGLQSPRNIQWKAIGSDWPVRPRTEFGLADRMADHEGDRLRWCPQLATWMSYRSGVWMTATKEAGFWAAQAMLRRLEFTEALSYDEEPDVGPDDVELPSPRALFLEWVAKQHTVKASSAAAKLAAGTPLMQMDQATFDSEPTLLNVRNGVVDLTTGKLRAHSPEDRMTLQCGAAYRQEDAPQWEEFLRRVQPDPAMRAYLQRVIGYCATGRTDEQVFFLWHGRGANGKSVAQKVIARVLGTYAQTMPVDTLMASSLDGRIPNDVARMAGKRFLVASETKAGKALDEARLKALTGGDTISARFMRAEWFEFEVVGKVQLTTNHLPKLSDDNATWRRIHLITWPVEIPEGERDGSLPERLFHEEGAGILRWIVDGAMEWHQQGLAPPEQVIAARESYREEEDVVGQFLADCCDLVDPVRGAIGRSTGEIWNAWSAWARREGHAVIGQRLLTQRMKKKHEYYRGGSWAGFPGIQVRLDLPGA